MAAAIRIAAADAGITSKAPSQLRLDGRRVASASLASSWKFTRTISRLIALKSCRDACGRGTLRAHYELARNPTARSRLHQYLDRAAIKFRVPAGGGTLPLRISPAVTGLP